MRYFMAVLLDQGLVSLASYLFLRNIIISVDDDAAVGLLQINAICMLAYPLLNGILCFRLIEEQSDQTVIYARDLLWMGVMVSGIGAICLVWFGIGEFLVIALVLIVVNALSHVARMIAMSCQGSRSLAWASVGLAAAVAFLVALAPSDASALLLFLPILVGRLLYAVISATAITRPILFRQGRGRRRMNLPRFLAAIIQYARTNVLFFLFSVIAPASAALELRIVELCLVPIRQFSVMMQNYLIPRGQRPRDVLRFAIIAVFVLSPLAALLLMFLGIETERFGFLIAVVIVGVALILLSNAGIILLRMQEHHTAIWKMIAVAIIASLPVAIVFALMGKGGAISILVLEAIILLLLVPKAFGLRGGEHAE